MDKKLALLTRVYNAAEAVNRQAAIWRQLPPEQLDQLEILIADDYSDTPPDPDRSGLPMRLFRITSDIPWNMAGAKNLLRKQATAPWLLFFDVDNHLPADERLLLLQSLDRLDPAKLYMFKRSMEGQEVDPHINTFLVHRDVVDAAGGFGEDFCGHYGYEDVFFHHLLMQRKVDRVLLVNMCFIQAVNAATLSLDWDSSRNNALIQAKVARGEGTSPDQLRFSWIDVPQIAC